MVPYEIILCLCVVQIGLKGLMAKANDNNKIIVIILENVKNVDPLHVI